MSLQKKRLFIIFVHIMLKQQWFGVQQETFFPPKKLGLTTDSYYLETTHWKVK